jgi:hypothetical protein
MQVLELGLGELFRRYDKDHSGDVDAQEFAVAVRQDLGEQDGRPAQPATRACSRLGQTHASVSY